MTLILRNTMQPSKESDNPLDSTLQCSEAVNLSSEVYQRYIHNSTQPIAKLPAELLAKIFEICCSSDYPKLDKLLSGWFDYGVIWSTRSSLLQTCSNWRRVGVATPSLWSKLDHSKPGYSFSNKYLHLEVERAKQLL